MFDIKRIPIPALIGIILTTLFVLAAIFARRGSHRTTMARSSATSGN